MTQRTFRRKLLFSLILTFLALLLVAVPAYVVYKPIKAASQSWISMYNRRTLVTPADKPVYRDDAELGFVANPGHYHFVETDVGVPGALVYDAAIGEDGSRATFTTLRSNGLDQRPQDTLVRAVSASAEALYGRMLRERPQRTLLRLDAATAIRLFQSRFGALQRSEGPRSAVTR